MMEESVTPDPKHEFIELRHWAIGALKVRGMAALIIACPLAAILLVVAYRLAIG